MLAKSILVQLHLSFVAINRSLISVRFTRRAADCVACYTLQYTSTQCTTTMLPLSNKYTESIDGGVGEDGLFNGDYVKQVYRATNSLFDDMCSKVGVKHASDLRACYLHKPQVTKALLLQWLETMVFLLDCCTLPRLDTATEQKQ